jgi:preprotein translocase subunit SecA
LALQMIDALWVEHLEVMQYTRSSVNLRAYGQRDPLVEYRKEGTHLFAMMQQTILERIASVLPQIQPAAVARDEALHRAEASAALAASQSGKVTGTTRDTRPVIATVVPGRNDMVTITNGIETKTVKYKKAEGLLVSGWTIVS